MTERPADRATAFHEAGHAVAAFLGRVPVRRVTIDPASDTAGMVRLFSGPIDAGEESREMTPNLRDRVERHVRISLAGHEAQRIGSPSSVRGHHARQDRANAADAVDLLSTSEAEASAYLRLLEVQTRGIVERNWMLVEALAEALMDRRTMTGKEVVGFLRGRTTEGIASNRRRTP